MGSNHFFIKQILPFAGEITKQMSISHIFSLIFATFFMLEQVFSRESDSTTTNVRPSVCLSVCPSPKPPNSLKSIISPYHYLHYHSHHQTTSHPTLHTTSNTSSYNITHTPSPTQPCTWATFKLFSLFGWILACKAYIHYGPWLLCPDEPLKHLLMASWSLQKAKNRSQNGKFPWF